MTVPRGSHVVSRLATRSVDPVERIDFWEECNRQALVGLTCSSYSQDCSFCLEVVRGRGWRGSVLGPGTLTDLRRMAASPV